MATTTVVAAEAQARRHAATTPGETVQPAAPAPAGLTTAAFSPTRSRAAAPEYATGARFVNGNQLRGTFADPLPGEATSMTIRWSVPPNCTIDFGDGETHAAGPLGETVVHEYDERPADPNPWIFDARIVDEHGRLRGEHRFALPHGISEPHDVAAMPASRFPIP